MNKALPILAAERPDIFNAYQQTQGERLEKAMLGAAYVASSLATKRAKTLFVGLYSIGKSRPLTKQQYWQIPAYIEMKKFGLIGFSDAEDRSSILWFDLTLTDFYSAWKGKLVVQWPPPERSWWRRAHRNQMAVAAILEESALEAAMPPWQEMVITWETLKMLPSRWRSVLSQWRGIYYILDTSDGRGYVGSACGADNLLGRWLNYAASGHGGNALLRKRNPRNFRFSILQRLSPDLEPNEVIRVEGTWKERLRTRSPYGLNDN